MSLRIQPPPDTLVAFFALALGGCAQLGLGGSDASLFPTLPGKPPGAVAAAASTTPLIAAGERRNGTRIAMGPAPPEAAAPNAEPTHAPPTLAGRAASITIEQMPLPTFINTVLGETLHLNFQLDQQVASRNDLVTLRFSGPLPAQELLSITTEVLKSYGVELVYQGDLVRVRQSDALRSEMPQIVLGRATPDVALNLRPIFQMVPLGQVGSQDMAGWITTAYGKKITVFPSASNNALMILGTADDVHAALEGIRLLDQPRLAGRRSLRIDPVFWSATGLADKLTDVLRAEGYNASGSVQPPAALTLLPITKSNTVLVFTADRATLDHIASWARDLDRPSQIDPGQSVFYYPVRNTTAESLAKVLNEVLRGQVSAPRISDFERSALPPPPAGRAAPTPGQPPPSAAPPVNGGGAAALPQPPQVVTDVARNALIFLGSPEAYAQLHPLIESLDQAPREVLIEVTVAEVTLNGAADFGVEWQTSVGLGEGDRAILGTIMGGLGIGTAGFNVNVINSSGGRRAILNALQTLSNTKVLSTPRLLARSGATARIQVGSDVPIVVSQGTTAQLVTNATSDILQQIQYRSVGVILNVKPVIYAGSEVDLDISQEVSSVASTSTGGIQSPTINNRNVTTQLSLNDGATVVLGGLIQDTKNDTNQGLPYLKDIPGIGVLFRVQHHDETKTELLVFITPYIISSSADSDRITDSFREKMQQWPEPNTNLTW